MRHQSNDHCPGGHQVKYRILGPLEVTINDSRVVIGAGQLRAILAILLIHYERVVPVHTLIEMLWGANPPRTYRSSLQLRVSQLRCLLPDTHVVYQPPGYTLHLNPCDLDMYEFQRLSRLGSGYLDRDDPAGASMALHAALELWRGEPLENVEIPSVAGFAGHLNKLRLAALTDRIEADLRLGRRNLVMELEPLAAAWPLNERLCGQLMLALYRDGRPVEALDTYRRIRARLSTELGLDTGFELRWLEQAILQRNPVLDASTTGLGHR